MYQGEIISVWIEIFSSMPMHFALHLVDFALHLVDFAL